MDPRRRRPGGPRRRSGDARRSRGRVNEGFDGSTAQEDWKAETALQDAHDYVDAYVVDDENRDEDIRDALTDPQLRHAVDYAVRDVILDEIAERASA